MKTKILRKRFIVLVLLLMLTFTTIFANTAFAAPAASPSGKSATSTIPDPGTSDVVNKVLVEVQAKLSPFVSTLQSLLWPILLMIGSLLQNDLLFGAGMEDSLLLIWTNVRNIVNILFVFILLAIAFYNVFGAGENYTIKKELPKFIIALVAVNFTYIGVKVALDAVNIVSTALFALPNSVQRELGPHKDGSYKIGVLSKEQADGICSGIIGAQVGSPNYLTKYKALTAAEPKTATAKPGNHSICLIENDKEDNIFTVEGKKFFSQFGAQNAALVLAVAMGKTNLLSTVMVPPSSLTVGSLIKNSLFSIILYVIYATAFITLFVVLLVRIVVLWIMIVLSPLMVLKYALPQSIAGSLGDTGTLQKKFVTHLIIPIKISLVLSIGFIMLDALQKYDFSKAQSAVSFLSIKTVDIDLLTSGISTLQDFIVAIGMIAFVWVGVFQSLKETAAEGAVNAIKGAVGGVGKFIGKLPLMAPIFPVGGKKPPASIGALGYALQQAGNIPYEAAMSGAKKSGLLIGSGAETIQTMYDASTRSEFVNAATQARSMSHESDYRKAAARYYDRNLRELEKDFQSTLHKGTYKSASDFLNDLKNNPGKIPNEVMGSFLDAAGIRHGTLSERQGSTNAKEHLSDPQIEKLGKREDLLKTNAITKDEKEKLDALNAAIEKGDTTLTARTKNEAEPILNRLIAIESTETIMEVKIKSVGIDDSKAQERFNMEMKDKIEVLVNAGATDSDAQKKVVEAVSKGMSDEQHSKFKDLIGDELKLLQEAAQVKSPAAPAQPPAKKVAK